MRIGGDILFGFLCLSIGMCGPDYDITPMDGTDLPKDHLFMEVREKDSIVIFWNPPKDTSCRIKKYELFYRPGNDTSWILIKDSIPPHHRPKTTILRNQISRKDSIFFFKVRYQSTDETYSTFHSCIDTRAVTGVGWFLYWKGNL